MIEQKPSTSSKRHRPKIATTDIDIRAELARVRAREEKRLLKIAYQAGLFDWRIPSKDLQSTFEAVLAIKKRKTSQLFKLTKRLHRASKSKRQDETKRKIILGGFIVAQCRHKPDLHAKLAHDIREYFKQTSTHQSRQRNLDYLADFLTDPHHIGINDETPNADKEGLTHDQHRERTHRQILLGTWLLARYNDDPDIAHLVVTELDGFLSEEKNPAQHRRLLADLLKKKAC